MPYFIFFANKPLSIIPFILGLIACVLIAIQQPPIPFNLMFLIFPFLIWYPFFMLYYYVLRKSDNIEVRGVDISKLKKAFEVTFLLHLICIPGLIWLGLHLFPSVILPALFVMIYAAISWKCLEQYCLAKFVSEGIKKNVSWEDLNLKAIYSDLREVLTKTLIK